MTDERLKVNWKQYPGEIIGQIYNNNNNNEF